MKPSAFITDYKDVGYTIHHVEKLVKELIAIKANKA